MVSVLLILEVHKSKNLTFQSAEDIFPVLVGLREMNFGTPPANLTIGS